MTRIGTGSRVPIELELTDFEASSATEDLVTDLLRPGGGIAHTRTVRTVPGQPAGEETSEDEPLPTGFSRPLSDVSDGQCTSPARRHRWFTASKSSSVEDRRNVIPAQTRKPPSAAAGSAADLRRDAAVLVRPDTAEIAVDARPQQLSAAIQVSSRPDAVDVGVNPLSAHELATWQLPPQVDMEAIAALMVCQPVRSRADVQRIAEQNLPHRDNTPYGRSAVRLAVYAMTVYEERLRLHFHQLSSLGYADDATGWTSLRLCQQQLDNMAQRP